MHNGKRKITRNTQNVLNSTNTNINYILKKENININLLYTATTETSFGNKMSWG